MTDTTDLAQTIRTQRVRAEGIAAVLDAQRAGAPHIDPDGWRGAAASAQRADADRLHAELGAAERAGADAVAALVSAEVAADA